jgi:putative endonuclease
MKIHYVYILESISTPEHFYIGYTRDLRGRLQKHQPTSLATRQNIAPGSSKPILLSKPRKIAGRFERYLKSGSGRAFSKSHLCDSAAFPIGLASEAALQGRTPSAAGNAITVVGASYSEFFIRVYSSSFASIRGCHSWCQFDTGRNSVYYRCTLKWAE